MRYQFDQTERPGYLEFRVHGKRNFKDAYQFWTAVAERLEQSGFRRVLVEFDLEGDAPDLDFQVLLSKLKNWSSKPWDRIAVVDHQPKRIIFLSINETDERFPAKMFSDIEKAREWLQE